MYFQGNSKCFTKKHWNHPDKKHTETLQLNTFKTVIKDNTNKTSGKKEVFPKCNNHQAAPRVREGELCRTFLINIWNIISPPSQRRVLWGGGSSPPAALPAVGVSERRPLCAGGGRRGVRVPAGLRGGSLPETGQRELRGSRFIRSAAGRQELAASQHHAAGERRRRRCSIASVGEILNVLFQYQSTHDNKGIPTVAVNMTGCVIT